MREGFRHNQGMSKTATTPTRIAKAALLIDRVKVDDKGRQGMFSVDSTSGTTYRCIIWPSSWTCNCKWGDVHAFEMNNECAHALAARYYAQDHDINLGADITEDITNRPQAVLENRIASDPFEGL